MARKVEEEMVDILIPKDPSNKEVQGIRFQHDGKDFYVVCGKLTKVPAWVKKNAIDAHYIEAD